MLKIIRNLILLLLGKKIKEEKEKEISPRKESEN